LEATNQKQVMCSVNKTGYCPFTSCFQNVPHSVSEIVAMTALGCVTNRELSERRSSVWSNLHYHVTADDTQTNEHTDRRTSKHDWHVAAPSQHRSLMTTSISYKHFIRRGDVIFEYQPCQLVQ